MTRYEGAAYANASNYVLLSARGKAGADNIGGDGGAQMAAGGDGREVADQRNILTRFMMHGKLMASGVELAAEKAASNRGRRRGRGSGPCHPPKKVELSKSRLMRRLAGRETANEDNHIMGNLAYGQKKGGSSKAREGLAFTLSAQT